MYILSETRGPTGILTLNYPEKRNALSAALVEELLAAFAAMRQSRVKTLILRAAAEARVWSAGHNINELPLGDDPLLYSDPLERLLRAIKKFPAPVIAMVHGSVWGGATDVVLSCDLVIGDETASFAVTPANLGLPYNTVGILNFMRRLPLNLVKEMFFTARVITAQEADKWGILNHLVSSSELEIFTLGIALTIAGKAPLTVSAIKEQMHVLMESSPLAPEVFERIEELRHGVYKSKDYAEGIKAFQEKRKPVFKGE